MQQKQQMEILGFNDKEDPRLSNIDQPALSKMEKESDLQKSMGSLPGFDDDEDDDAADDLQKQLDQIKNDLGKSAAFKGRALLDLQDEDEDEEQEV